MGQVYRSAIKGDAGVRPSKAGVVGRAPIDVRYSCIGDDQFRHLEVRRSDIFEELRRGGVPDLGLTAAGGWLIHRTRRSCEHGRTETQYSRDDDEQKEQYGIGFLHSC